ncbi:phiSA1p31-related protein [Streptomyces youssoufiensis]
MPDTTQYEYGRLDRARRTWTDGTGHTTDLSLTWMDQLEQRWTWTGGVHPVNGPILRSSSRGGMREPLDLVLALWAPLVPVPATCAECDHPVPAGRAYCSALCRNAADDHGADGEPAGGDGNA